MTELLSRPGPRPLAEPPVAGRPAGAGLSAAPASGATPSGASASGAATTLVLPLRATDRGRRELLRWRAGVEASSDAVVLLDAQGRVVASSTTGAALLGTDPPTALGRRLAELADCADVPGDPADPAVLPGLTAALPPLRALSTGQVARGLVRLRAGAPAPVVGDGPDDDEVLALDVVALPLGGGVGVLALLLAV